MRGIFSTITFGNLGILWAFFFSETIHCYAYSLYFCNSYKYGINRLNTLKRLLYGTIFFLTAHLPLSFYIIFEHLSSKALFKLRYNIGKRSSRCGQTVPHHCTRWSIHVGGIYSCEYIQVMSVIKVVATLNKPTFKPSFKPLKVAVPITQTRCWFRTWFEGDSNHLQPTFKLPFKPGARM